MPSRKHLSRSTVRLICLKGDRSTQGNVNKFRGVRNPTRAPATTVSPSALCHLRQPHDTQRCRLYAGSLSLHLPAVRHAAAANAAAAAKASGASTCGFSASPPRIRPSKPSVISIPLRRFGDVRGCNRRWQQTRSWACRNVARRGHNRQSGGGIAARAAIVTLRRPVRCAAGEILPSCDDCA